MNRTKTFLELRHSLMCCIKAADTLGAHLTAAHICTALDHLADEEKEIIDPAVDLLNRIDDSRSEGGGG